MALRAPSVSAGPQLEARLRSSFEEAFGGQPAAVAIAPGRINVIGEHTDYTGGLALPAAIDRYLAVGVRPRGENQVNVVSDGFPVMARLETLPGSRRGHWSDYVVGVARELAAAAGGCGGFDAAIVSDLPVGAGLSSSGALEVASALALLAAWGMEMRGLEIALLCQRAENAFVGARTGIMDQVAALFGRAGSALILDCRSLAWEAVPLPDDRFAFLLADTGVRHELAADAYNDRRLDCERAQRLLGVTDLRGVTSADLDRIPDACLRRRVRHVISENGRVRQAVEALRRRDVAALGPLLEASHASLRDDFEVSCAELDRLVELAAQVPAVVGARMMGGGFGGCVLLLAHREGLEGVEEHLRRGYAEAFQRTPAFHRVRSVNGALAGDGR
jgi:galactokinase